MPDFLLPDLGEGLEEAEVIAWRVKPGDRVTVDQVIAEVETAKAVVEVPVPYSGVVATLHAEPGAVVAVGQPLVTIEARETGFREPGVVTAGGSGEEASGSVLIGYGTTAAPPRTRRGRRRAVTTAPPPAPGLGSGPGSGASPRSRRVPVISPLVRKQAREAGLDLAALTGTGPGGVVSRRDVRQAIAARAAGQPAPAGEGARPTTPAPYPHPAQLAAPDGEVQPARLAAPVGGTRRIPLRGARRAAAEKLSRSRREIPEATVWVDVDATGTVETRRAMNAADPGQPVSLLALLARFAILGLRRYPELNSRVEADEIVIAERVGLGFAAQTEHGLVVPVVPAADLLTTRELSARLAEHTTAARERRLAPADLTGGTFTVNNYGVFGVDGSAAIINHPEVAILGMGRVIDRPWVVGGQLTVRKVAELTLSFDHRVCDGGTAGGFLRYVADCIESPASAMGDM